MLTHSRTVPASRIYVSRSTAALGGGWTGWLPAVSYAVASEVILRARRVPWSSSAFWG